MNFTSRLRVFALCFSLSLLLTGTLHAQNTKPLILPMADPPGPATWLLGQPYGNTVGAYLRGDQWYSAGQRLHFGLDFSMPCGTPLIAMGDGEVTFVDDMGFGSAPHNLLIRYDVGVVALYGHLLEHPPVSPGQRVTAGDVVGSSGDPDLTCTSRPHLHLELRSLDYLTTYNPVSYIDANWHALASIGSFGYPLFEQDLDNVRQWMSLDDQPNVSFGGRALNLYNAPYPDYRNGQPTENPPLASTVTPLDPSATASLRRLAFEGCCTGSWWNPLDSTTLYTIDGSPGQRAVIFEWDVERENALELIGEAPPPFTSADATYTLAPVNDQEFAIRAANGTETIVNTGGDFPALSADNSKILYFTSEGEPPATSIWIANTDGSDSRTITTLEGGSARWLDANRLLISERDELITRLSVLDTATGESFMLGQWERLRGIRIAPGGGRLMFFVVNQPDPAASGTYVIDTSAGATAQQLDWFGTWVWRDADSVYYVPFEPEQSAQTMRYFNVVTREDRALTDPATQPFLIANGDWSASPDGNRIVFWNAIDMTTWLMEIG